MFEISTSKIPQYSNSFFVIKVFEWNHLEEIVVRTPSVDSRSETTFVHRQYIDGALSTPSEYFVNDHDRKTNETVSFLLHASPTPTVNQRDDLPL